MGPDSVAVRSIMFSGPMVRALLDGRKTQTRRIVKPQPELRDIAGAFASWVFKGGLLYPNARDKVLAACPYGVPGDRLWVREALLAVDGGVTYQADGVPVGHVPADAAVFKRAHRPAMLMPRWASRITLEITDVRVQHVAEISEEDALAEGCEPRPSGTWWQGYRDFGDKLGLIHQQHRGETPPDWMIEAHKMSPTPWLDRSALDAFRNLWEQINPGSWAPNPWVWALTFKRVDLLVSTTGIDRD